MEDGKSRLWLRKRGGEGIWYMRVGTELKSTGRPEADRAGAEEDLARHLAEVVRNLPRGSAAAGVPVVCVLDEWVARTDQEASMEGDPVVARRRRATSRTKAKLLAALLGELDLGDLNPEVVAAYQNLRMGASGENRSKALARLRLPPDAGQTSFLRKAVAANSVAGELVVLRWLVRDYVKRYGLCGMPEIPVPKRVPRGRVEVSRGDLARLLWAARGRRWDAEADRWATSPTGTAKGGVDRSTAHLARMILAAAYTASACWCVIRLDWSGDPEGTRSFVDLDASPPLLYRLGPDDASGKRAGCPVVLNRRIATHLRRWREADARQGFESVVHYRGRPLAYSPHGSFKKLVAAAGLPDEIQMDDLSHSAGGHIAAREGVSIWGAGLLMGISTDTFHNRYHELRPKYQEEAVKALSRKPGRRLP